MLDAVVVEKGEIIDRAVKRAREELSAAPDFETDYTRQDAAVVNVQRACEAAIDIGNRLLFVKRLGPANDGRGIFEKLSRAGIIDKALEQRLIGMIGFRNVAVHSYRELDLNIVEHVIRTDLDDLFTFANLALQATRTD